MKSASSVHLAGDVTDNGQRMSLNMSVTRAGDMDGQVAAGNQSYTVLVTGGQAYVRVDAAFLKLAHLPSSLCATICGKYIKAPASSVSSLAGGASWSTFVGAFAKMPDLSYAGATTVDGAPAWKIRGNTSSDAVYLAAAAPHFPVRIVHNHQRLDFSEWNAATIPPAPKGKKLVNLSTLAG